MPYPVGWHPFISGFVVIYCTGNIAIPFYFLSGDFVPYWAIPLPYLYPRREFWPPHHVSIRYPAICAIPKFVKSIGSVAVLGLRLRINGKSCSHHIAGRKIHRQTLLRSIFSCNKNRPVFPPGTI